MGVAPALRAYLLRRLLRLVADACQLPQACSVKQADPLTSERYETLHGKALEPAADDFPDAAQFVGQRLVSSLDRLGLAEQQFGQPLVEAVEGDFLNELHQFGNAIGEQVKDEVAEAGIAGDQRFKKGCRKDEQLQRCLCDSARGIGRVTEQTTGRDDAGAARLNAVKQHFATGRRRLHHLDGSGDQQGKPATRLPFGIQFGAFGEVGHGVRFA